MIFRMLALSFALLIGIGVIIPLATNHTEAGERRLNNRKKSYKKYKKYSKGWWRSYRIRLRKRKALAARRRALRLRQIRLSKRSGTALNRSPGGNVGTPSPTIQAGNLFLLVEGRISKVYEGDSIQIETKDGKSYLVQMLGVNAPDLGDDLGRQSQQKLSELILGKVATVIIRKRDSIGRYIGNVYAEGRDVNLQQIELGMARRHRQIGYEPTENDLKDIEQAEQKARAERQGLWGAPKTSNAIRYTR